MDSLWIHLYFLHTSVVSPGLVVFSCVFPSLFVLLGFFSSHFHSSLFLLLGQNVSQRLHWHFWGTSLSKQWSVVFGERDNGTVSSTHCSKVLFRLGTSDFLLKKCCIRLLKFCDDFWSNFSCVCACCVSVKFLCFIFLF